MGDKIMVDTRYKDTYKLAIEDLTNKVKKLARTDITVIDREITTKCTLDTIEFLDKCIKYDLEEDDKTINSLRKELKGL